MKIEHHARVHRRAREASNILERVVLLRVSRLACSCARISQSHHAAILGLCMDHPANTPPSSLHLAIQQPHVAHSFAHRDIEVHAHGSRLSLPLSIQFIYSTCSSLTSVAPVDLLPRSSDVSSTLQSSIPRSILLAFDINAHFISSTQLTVIDPRRLTAVLTSCIPLTDSLQHVLAIRLVHNFPPDADRLGRIQQSAGEHQRVVLCERCASKVDTCRALILPTIC